MSNKDSHLKILLSPNRSGTYFAPFRSRSANPEGFDSKMKHWICAIEEWTINKNILTFSLEDISREFISVDLNIRPDKECIRLVLSEMKRKTLIIPFSCLKSSQLWTQQASPLLDNILDPHGWLNWGMKNLVLSPAKWALSTVTPTQDVFYSDLTDLSIKDDMSFVSVKALEHISHNLKNELSRISKAEHRNCFEWPQLIELLDPIINSIIDAKDKKEALKRIEIIMDYLAIKKYIAISKDGDVKVVKIATNSDDTSDNVTITEKDLANARLLKAKDLLTNDADRLYAKAQEARQAAIENYKKQNIVKAKSLLRTYKRLSACAEQRETQLNNVEHLLDQLESTDSNIIVVQAYKDGAEALKVANTKFEDMSIVMDDFYDATAEANHLQQTFNEMVNEVTQLTQPNDMSLKDLEAELQDYANQSETQGINSSIIQNKNKETDNSYMQPEKTNVDSLIAQLDDIVINKNVPSTIIESTPKKEVIKNVAQ